MNETTSLSWDEYVTKRYYCEEYWPMSHHPQPVKPGVCRYCGIEEYVIREHERLYHEADAADARAEAKLQAAIEAAKGDKNV